MVLITIVTGAYPPTYNWGASHCIDIPIENVVLHDLSHRSLKDPGRRNRGKGRRRRGHEDDGDRDRGDRDRHSEAGTLGPGTLGYESIIMVYPKG